jgi:hypothetical protein
VATAKDTTPNFKFILPRFNQQTWQNDFYNNMRAIDAIITRFFNIANYVGVWQNSAQYSVGERVLDTSTAQIFEVLVDHITNPEPTTFSEFRQNNPTFYETFTQEVQFRGEWQSNTEYAAGDFITYTAASQSENEFAVAVSSHTSTNSYTTDRDNGRWNVLLRATDLSDPSIKLDADRVEYTPTSGPQTTVEEYLDNLSTDDVSEANNLYYTDARVNTRIDTRVDKGFVDALNVNADTVDGSNASDFAPASHVGSGGSAHADASQSTDGFMSSSDKTKLDGIESGATADQTASEIKTAYENNADTNAFTDSEQSKLAGIESGAEVNDVDSVAGKTGAVTLDTDDVSEGANLYHTDERAQDAVGNIITGLNDANVTYDDAGNSITVDVTVPVDSVAGKTGAVTLDTDDVSEGSNLYYTDARVNADIDNRVDKAFVDALNVDADTVDGNEASALLDRSNHTGTQSGNTIDGGTITNFASTGIDDNASSTAININSSGNVGIGTSSPAALLDAVDGSPADPGFLSTDRFLVRSTVDTGQTLQAGDTGVGFINFANQTSRVRGQILYDNANDYLRFQVNKSEAARFDSSGNVGIGTSSPNGKLDVKSDGTDSEILKLASNLGSAGTRDLRFLSPDTDDTASPFKIDTNNSIGFAVDGTVLLTVGDKKEVLGRNGADFFTDGDAATYLRWPGRMLIGEAWQLSGDSGTTSPDSSGSWLQDQKSTNGTETLQYIEDQARVTVNSVGNSNGIHSNGSGSIAFSAAATGSSSAIAGAFIGKGDGNGAAQKGWATYVEGIRGDSFENNEAMCGEWNVVNLRNNTGVDDIEPYGGVPDGHSGGLSIASGGDANVNPDSFPANHALRIFNNGNSFRTGIVFQSTALETITGSLTGSNQKYAIKLGGLHTIAWYKSGGAEAINMWGDNAGDFHLESPGVKFNQNGRRAEFAQADTGPLLVNRLNTNGALISFEKDGSSVGAISYDGTDVVINQASDERLKTNVQPAPDAGTIFDNLQVRSFDWRESKEHKRYGFVAQELQQHFPEAVYEGGEDPETDPWTYDPVKLVPLLIKEIQSLRQRVKELEAKEDER